MHVILFVMDVIIYLCGTDVMLTMEHEDIILKVLMKARDEYYFIGKGIGLDSSDLEEIEMRHLHDTPRCLCELLKHRIQQGGLTLSILCNARELIKRDDVAQEIEVLFLLTLSPVSC